MHPQYVLTKVSLSQQPPHRQPNIDANSYSANTPRINQVVTLEKLKTLPLSLKACYRFVDGSSSGLICRADLALYEAKSSGRNCVRIWDETMSKLLKAGELEPATRMLFESPLFES